MSVKSTLASIREDYFRFPLYILANPFKGYDRIKYEKKGKISVCVVMLAVMFLLNILEYLYAGFPVNYRKPQYIRTVMILFQTIGPVLLFSVANWSITCLIDGAGKMKEIFYVVMYAQYMGIYLHAIALILTNVLTLSEMPVANFFYGLAALILCLYTFIGLIVIHEFSFSKAVGSIILTFAALAVIMFIILLLSSLVGEFIQFIRMVVSEFSLHYL